MSTHVHRGTASVAAHNSCGWPVRQVDYLRTIAGETPVALITRQEHDVAGRIVAQWDARLPIANITTVYGLAGNPLKVDSVDAGWRVTVPGLASETLERHDARGSVWRTTYDDQLRVVAVEENAQPDVETFTYADGLADAEKNLRGRLLTQIDSSGRFTLDSYGLQGTPLQDTRTFDDGQAYSSRRTFSPLGAVMQEIDAGGHHRRSHYDLAGQLKQVQLQLNNQSDWQAVLLDAQYNAAGKIIEQKTANNVVSRWHYHPATGRLHRQTAQLGQQAALQDFEYEYDKVGNITRILDHAFTRSYFANQRVDGHRVFSYDSLYRLISASGYDDAPPTDIPGKPHPTDPADRRNYSQTFSYDEVGNLIELRHVRDGNSYTRRMRIDPNSNRGVRINENDPEPDFDKLFDAHGNLLALQPGRSLNWNSRDQLAKVTLVERENLANDEEHYRYSQGVRVYKRLDTDANKHFHEVRYLPGLEIRTKDTGEQLHVITVAAGAGSMRCLRWIASPPPGVVPDQLRYSFDDHLGSCLLELDQSGQIISQEGFYAFGQTAWLLARSQIEVEYKFIRYSGKEMDVSGLNAHGKRYYAPWLQRWISADPEGAVDGTNLYAYVGGNPMRFVDADGGSKSEADIRLSAAFISAVGGFAEHTNQVMHNVINQKHLVRNLLFNAAIDAGKGAAGAWAGGEAGALVNDLVPSVPGIPFLDSGGLTAGNAVGDAIDAVVNPLANFAGNKAGLMYGPLIPQTSTMSVAKINSDLGIKEPRKEIKNAGDFVDHVVNPALDAVLNPEFVMNRVIGSFLGTVPASLSVFSRAIEVEDIKNGLDPVKVGKIESMYTDWQGAVNEHAESYEAAFKMLGSDVIASSGIGKDSISLASLREQTRAVQADISQGLAGIAAYKTMNTTDNRFLRAQAHPTTQKHSSLYKWWTREG
jgi:insecticidal toxin complex protein TccC